MSNFVDTDRIDWRVIIPTNATIAEENMIYQARKLVASQPKVDVVDVVHGEWIDSTDETFSPSHKCSRCGHIINELATDDINATEIERENYCPHCGAKMDKKGEPDELHK